MQLFVFVALWFFAYFLARARLSESFKFNRFIPGMLFFRISLTAAILWQVFIELSFNSDVVEWIDVASRITLYFGIVQMFLDIL